MTAEDRRTRRLRELPRYVMLENHCYAPAPDGTWVRWAELAAVLDTEGDRPVCTCKPYGEAARKGLDPEGCPIHGNAGAVLSQNEQAWKDLAADGGLPESHVADTEGDQPTPPVDVLDALHAVMTRHGIASRSLDKWPSIEGDLVRWAVAMCRQSRADTEGDRQEELDRAAVVDWLEDYLRLDAGSDAVNVLDDDERKDVRRNIDILKRADTEGDQPTPERSTLTKDEEALLRRTIGELNNRCKQEFQLRARDAAKHLDELAALRKVAAPEGDTRLQHDLTRTEATLQYKPGKL